LEGSLLLVTEKVLKVITSCCITTLCFAKFLIYLKLLQYLHAEWPRRSEIRMIQFSSTRNSAWIQEYICRINPCRTTCTGWQESL